jgi:hypothetical protein
MEKSEIGARLAAIAERRRFTEQRLRNLSDRIAEMDEERETLLGEAALARQALADFQQYVERLEDELAETVRLEEARVAFEEALDMPAREPHHEYRWPSRKSLTRSLARLHLRNRTSSSSGGGRIPLHSDGKEVALPQVRRATREQRICQRMKWNASHTSVPIHTICATMSGTKTAAACPLVNDAAGAAVAVIGVA